MINHLLSKKGIVNSTKKVVMITVLFSLIFTSMVFGNEAQVAVYSDVLALIDFLPIPSYNVNGCTFVVAEDLNSYGFDVDWNPQERALYISRNREKPYCDLMNEIDFIDKEQYNDGGIVYILQSDIKTYLDNMLVPSLNINGHTLISLDDLSKYGYLIWNESTLDFRGYPGYGDRPNYKKMNFDFIERGRTISLHMTHFELDNIINALPENEIVETSEIIYNSDLQTNRGKITYKGQMKKGKKNGLGYQHIEYYETGGPVEEFVGEFKDGKPYGKGIYIRYSTSLAGMWAGMSAQLQIGCFDDNSLNEFGVKCDPNVSGRKLEYGIYQKGNLLPDNDDIYPNRKYYSNVYYGEKFMVHTY